MSPSFFVLSCLHVWFFFPSPLPSPFTYSDTRPTDFTKSCLRHHRHGVDRGNDLILVSRSQLFVFAFPVLNPPPPYQEVDQDPVVHDSPQDLVSSADETLNASFDVAHG